MTLQTLASIQEAENCVYVNGSLIIHVSSIPNVVNELRFYLKNIVQVSDFILIYGSITLTSLHFLSSLQRVRGLRLYRKRYSLAVHDMNNLQALFLSNVTENLKVEKGTLRLNRNRMLCIKQITSLVSFRSYLEIVAYIQCDWLLLNSCWVHALTMTPRNKSRTSVSTRHYTHVLGLTYIT